MDPNKIFSQNSAFLQQYQADLSKQTSQENVSRHISLLTGKTAQVKCLSWPVNGFYEIEEIRVYYCVLLKMFNFYALVAMNTNAISS